MNISEWQLLSDGRIVMGRMFLHYMQILRLNERVDTLTFERD